MNTVNDYVTIRLQLIQIDKCTGSRNSLNDIPNRLGVPNKTRFKIEI